MPATSSLAVVLPACVGVFDPNVNYDEDADRFIMGIDADGTDYCIAVSQTGDPTGSWNLYSFSTAGRRDFVDYPHLGVGVDNLGTVGTAPPPLTPMQRTTQITR